MYVKYFIIKTEKKKRKKYCYYCFIKKLPIIFFIPVIDGAMNFIDQNKKLKLKLFSKYFGMIEMN